ncbi:MAG: hypothetical protein HQK67_00500 [Desulfamplus sp.]|nr:hypothetical protein [Desulfamplus sp.]
MSAIKSKCDLCELKGYSPELCKVHMRKMVSGKYDEDCPHYTHSFVKLGKTAAVGAGVGLAAACGSMCVIPAVALKALFGHVAVVKITAGAGGSVAGAGINVFRETKKDPGKELRKNHKRRRHFYFPLNLTGGDLNGQ